MSFATIEDLRSQLGARTPAQSSVEYAEKMLHKVPAAPVVERMKFILEQCRGKRVLEFGASGALHAAILSVASCCIGVDRLESHGPSCTAQDCGHGCVVGFDLDDVNESRLPGHDPDVIICGEVIEHLSNPGWFLTRLHRQFAGVPVVITVPNAFSAIGAKHVATGVENVNRDHVAWYSYRTLMTLLERVGYTKNLFAWYNGQPHTAEGLIVVTE